MSPNQKQLNDYISSHHEYLYTAAKNILKKINRTDLADELVSEVYLRLQGKIDSLSGLTISSIEAMYIRTMDKQITWGNTKFKKDYIEKVYNQDIDNIIEMQNEDRYLNDNMTDDNELDRIEQNEIELEKQHTQQNKLNIIYTNLESLPTDKRILFDLYTNKGYNTSGKLANYVGISRSSAHNLITNLKQRLTKDI
jgi:RNA polymerase sigma factor (sigma-70 family)